MKRVVLELDDDCYETLAALAREQGRFKKAVIQIWLREQTGLLKRRLKRAANPDPDPHEHTLNGLGFCTQPDCGAGPYP